MIFRFPLRAGMWFLLILMITACSGAAPTIPPISIQPTSERMLVRERGELFSTSGECVACHTGTKDKKGSDVSIDSAWRSTMMANAGRDPYYLASVRSEGLRYPDQRTVIEDKCGICHYPMAGFTAKTKDQAVRVLDEGFLNPQNPLHPLGIDGVSCTLCHQIKPGNMAGETGFSGNFQVDETTPSGTRRIYGPFPAESNAVTIMQSTSGFIPAQSMHISRPMVCLNCHTLFTPYITSDGKWSSELFPEQTPYLEWQNSSYHGSRFCQTCHMPAAEGEVLVSSVGGKERAPFSQHIFVGGNVYMLGLLEKNAAELRVTAEDAHFKITQNHTSKQLTQQTAQLTLHGERQGDLFNLAVKITSQVGHKFPSGFPSRRAWIHVTVQDSAGNVIFESGGYDDQGNIKGNDNDRDAARFEDHYLTINNPEQVQIYESIMGDDKGKVTTHLLSAARYLKDNRIVPAGFDKLSVPKEIGVIGGALTDNDFTGGGDQIVYAFPAGIGELKVTVELLYQSLGFQWAEKLNQSGNAEGQRFLNMVKSQPVLPVVVARQTIQLK